MYRYLEVCIDAFNWAKSQEFAGYSKFDALNSNFLNILAGDNYYLRRGFTSIVNKSPINLRPFFKVKKFRNPKGLALFSRACFNLYEITGEEHWIREAEHLLKIIISLTSRGKWSGSCWGYDHPWQNMTFFAPRYFPNAVVTVNVVEALLDAYSITDNEEYLKIGESASIFLLKDLSYMDVGPNRLCASYVPESDWKVINVNAMISSLFARLYFINNDESLKTRATYHMNWVIEKQTSYGAWYYSDPPELSTIKIDNYHTGFVLDSILNYQKFLNTTCWSNEFKNGLDYYHKYLFLEDGSPKWESDKVYPYDAHSSAQGIITFSMADRQAIATKILDWSLNEFYVKKDHRFIYQIHKYYKKRYTLMRWTQAWLTYALSFYLKSFYKDS